MPKTIEDTQILEESMKNAYLILTGKYTFEELFSRKNKGFWLPSKEEYPIDVVDDVISFYEREEEYEKCQELLKLKKKWQKKD